MIICYVEVMKRYFLVTLSVFLMFWISSYSSQGSSKEAQIEQIELKIQELEDKKMGFESRALRHENQADRLQFDDDTFLEMRRHNQLAEENRDKAAAVQKEIDRLQLEKAKIH